MFAYHEQKRKGRVRNTPADLFRVLPHNANMAKKPDTEIDYEALRQSSGWYAAAWRDFRGLTQQELAEEITTSRGQISDLETGAKTRFNRDWVAKFSAALDVKPGRLIDVNPFTMWEGQDEWDDRVRALDPDDRKAVLDMVSRLSKKTGTDG